jgi:hypothetical protein
LNKFYLLIYVSCSDRDQNQGFMHSRQALDLSIFKQFLVRFIILGMTYSNNHVRNLITTILPFYLNLGIFVNICHKPRKLFFVCQRYVNRFVCILPGIEPRALCILRKHSTTELHYLPHTHPAFSFKSYLEMRITVWKS